MSRRGHSSRGVAAYIINDDTSERHSYAVEHPKASVRYVAVAQLGGEEKVRRLVIARTITAARAAPFRRGRIAVLNTNLPGFIYPA